MLQPCPRCGKYTPTSATTCNSCGYSVESGRSREDQEGWRGWIHWPVGLITIFFLMWLAGCFVSSRDPVPELARELSRFPEYSIIVDDIDDSFFRNHLKLKSFFRVSEPIGEKPSEGKAAQFEQRVDTYTVIDRLVERYEAYVGMVVASKTSDGKLSGYGQAHPPFYQHVGHRPYGFWSPGGFWIWYGQYSFMRNMLGRHQISRRDYGSYVGSRSRGRPYYGPLVRGRPTFGARGSVTARTRPSFYQKHQLKQAGFRARARSRSGFRGK